MKHKGYNPNATSHVALKWKYNNREFEEALGLNMSEMTFRQYDPALGRFNAIDALADLVPSMTPYRFAFNNPIFFADPTGLFETRREARRYRRANGIRGGRIIKQDDGSFVLRGKNGIEFQAGDDTGFESSDLFPNDGVIQFASVVYDKSDAADKKQAQTDRYLFELKSQQHLQKHGWTPYEWKESRFEAIAGIAEFAMPTAIKTPLVPLTTKVKLGGFTPEFLAKLGKVLDRNGLTKVGRALQKHGSRTGSNFPRATGNAASINSQGDVVLSNIINNPASATTTRHHSRFGEILEIKAPNGQGARFHADGSGFIGFIEN